MEFSNLASRFLLQRFWREQHLIPRDPPKSWMFFLRLLGRSVLRADVSGIEIRAPIFIIGTPRCGSTMLHEILSCHERVAYITHSMDLFKEPEVFYAAEWLRRKLNLNVKGERYLGDSVQVDASSPSEGMCFWGQFLRRDPFDLSWTPRSLSDFSAKEIEGAIHYLKHVIFCFRDRGADRFLNKSPALVTEVELIHQIFPDARFIHLVRDGRMVANSMIKLYRRQLAQDTRTQHPLFKDRPLIPYPRVPRLAEYLDQWGPEDLHTTAHIWNDCVTYIDAIKDRLPHFHEMRFEDLLERPDDEMGKLLQACDLPPPATGAAAYRARISRIGKIQHKNVYSGFETVETIAADNLSRYGYLLAA
jgi:hypothetical protein